MRRRSIFGALAVVLALILSACGGEDINPNAAKANPGTGGGSGLTSATASSTGPAGNSEGIGPGSGEDAAGAQLNATATP